MTVKITKERLKDKAQDLINGNKDVEGSFLLTGAFMASVLSRQQAAKAIGVQPSQVGKFTSPKNSMTKGAARALAEAIIAAP